jgi:hypothetical protein
VSGRPAAWVLPVTAVTESSPSSDLKALALWSNEIIATTPLILPFSLSSLYLRCGVTPPTYLLDGLARQSHIKVLTLRGRSTALASTLPLLSNLAPNALYLKLDICRASKSVTHDFLRSCTQLKGLEVNASAFASCEHVPIPLQHLSLDGCQPPHVAALLDILSSEDAVAVSKLERLTLCIKTVKGSTIGETVGTWDRWSEVENVSNERKIKLKVEVY